MDLPTTVFIVSILSCLDYFITLIAVVCIILLFTSTALVFLSGDVDLMDLYKHYIFQYLFFMTILIIISSLIPSKKEMYLISGIEIDKEFTLKIEKD